MESLVTTYLLMLVKNEAMDHDPTKVDFQKSENQKPDDELSIGSATRSYLEEVSSASGKSGEGYDPTPFYK